MSGFARMVLGMSNAEKVQQGLQLPVNLSTVFVFNRGIAAAERRPWYLVSDSVTMDLCTMVWIFILEAYRCISLFCFCRTLGAFQFSVKSFRDEPARTPGSCHVCVLGYCICIHFPCCALLRLIAIIFQLPWLLFYFSRLYWFQKSKPRARSF